MGATNSLNLNCKVRVMKEEPVPSVSEKIGDIFRNNGIDRDSHHKYKTVSWLSYLYNGNSITWKACLYIKIVPKGSAAFLMAVEAWHITEKKTIKTGVLSTQSVSNTESVCYFTIMFHPYYAEYNFIFYHLSALRWHV